MGIFGLWLLWRIKDSVEQIREQTRRNQLTAAERSAEDAARAKEEMAEYRARQIIIVILSLLLVGMMIVASCKWY